MDNWTLLLRAMFTPLALWKVLFHASPQPRSRHEPDAGAFREDILQRISNFTQCFHASGVPRQATNDFWRAVLEILTHPPSPSFLRQLPASGVLPPRTTTPSTVTLKQLLTSLESPYTPPSDMALRNQDLTHRWNSELQHTSCAGNDAATVSAGSG